MIWTIIYTVILSRLSCDLLHEVLVAIQVSLGLGFFRFFRLKKVDWFLAGFVAIKLQGYRAPEYSIYSGLEIADQILEIQYM